MKRASLLIAFTALAVFGCGGSRLSHNEIRRQISEIGGSTLLPQSVNIVRIINQSGDKAIAETSVELAVQFERNSPKDPWKIASIRLGDQNWVSLPELIVALNEGRRRETAASMAKLAAGIGNYRQRNGGALPTAANIVILTDALHPQYMADLIRLDAWGNPIQYEIAGSTFRLSSFGVDGRPLTDDDIVHQEAPR